MFMFKIVMIIAVVILAAGWIAYGIWMRKVIEEEKQQPKQESKRLKKTKSEIADWAQQMANFKKTEIKRPPDRNEQNKPE